MSDRRLVLHIGTEKTGTTSIQRFLSTNRSCLAESGVFTPSSLDDGAGNHRWLPAIACNKKEADDFLRSKEVTSESELRNLIDAKLTEFRHEVESISNSESKWLISSEHLQSRLTEKSELDTLKSILSGLFDNIEILLYIRRPIHTAVSLLSTAIKTGSTMKSLPEPSELYWNNICNHRATIERWKACFPEAELTVRLFQKEDFKNGDLIDDFMRVAKIEASNRFKRPEMTNESLSLDGMRYMLELNQILPPFVGGRPSRVRKNIAEFINKETRGNIKYAPSTSEIQKYEQSFRESDDWVLERYFPKRNILWADGKCIFGGKDQMSLEVDESESALLKIIATLWERWPPLSGQ